jgi:hypothetical protein
MSLDFLEDLFNAADGLANRRVAKVRSARGRAQAASPQPTLPAGNGAAAARPDLESTSLSSWGALAEALRRRSLALARNHRAGSALAAGQQRSSPPVASQDLPWQSTNKSDGLSADGDAFAPARPPDGPAGFQDPRLPSCGCAICQASAVASGPIEAGSDSTRVGPRPIPFRPSPTLATPRPAGATTLKANVVDALSIRDSDVFQLETNPGADKTVYLNFVGANLTGTGWDTRSWDGVSPAFSLDSDTKNFSSLELAAIKEIFARVACDFAPFDINITTKPQSSDRIARTSTSDTIYGTTCLFSNISRQTGYSNAGGVAFLGVFSDVNNEYSKPALVFPDKISNSPKNIAEAASHEIGHNLGLAHDGSRGSAYYSGQGSSPGWAPIMGVGYYKDLVQFSRGSYKGANNTQNDLGIILSNGFSYWSDSVGNSSATAISLGALIDSDADGISDRRRQGGAIEITAADALGTPDRDVFSFVAPSDGSVNINIDNTILYYDPTIGSSIYAPVPSGYGNLRLDAQLADSNGVVLSDWNNDGELDVTNFNISGLRGSQTYYLSVFANANSPDGEDTYGSLGHYSIDLEYRSKAMSQPGIAVQLSVASVAEDSGTPLTFTFERSGDITNELTCFYKLAGTATSKSDYQGPSPGSNSIVFAAGSATATVVVNPIADDTIEANETVSVALLHGSGYALTSGTPVEGTIANDDVITYTLNAPTSVCEGQRVTVAISSRCVAPGTTLSWRLSGTGISAADFTPGSLSGTVKLDKSGNASVSFVINADLENEPTENLVFSLLDAGRQQVATAAMQIVNTIPLWGTDKNDTIVGQDQICEMISGGAASGTQPLQLGGGQVDVVTGGSGPDLFLLSQMRSRKQQMFYNDANNRTTGANDYMQIQDFNIEEDILYFAGGRYFTSNSGNDTNIWWDRNNNATLSTADNTNATDELIAVLKDVQLGSFTITNTSTLPWVTYV